MHECIFWNRLFFDDICLNFIIGVFVEALLSFQLEFV